MENRAGENFVNDISKSPIKESSCTTQSDGCDADIALNFVYHDAAKRYDKKTNTHNIEITLRTFIDLAERSIIDEDDQIQGDHIGWECSIEDVVNIFIKALGVRQQYAFTKELRKISMEGGLTRRMIISVLQTLRIPFTTRLSKTYSYSSRNEKQIQILQVPGASLCIAWEHGLRNYYIGNALDYFEFMAPKLYDAKLNYLNYVENHLNIFPVNRRSSIRHQIQNFRSNMNTLCEPIALNNLDYNVTNYDDRHAYDVNIQILTAWIRAMNVATNYRAYVSEHIKYGNSETSTPYHLVICSLFEDAIKWSLWRINCVNDLYWIPASTMSTRLQDMALHYINLLPFIDGGDIPCDLIHIQSQAMHALEALKKTWDSDSINFKESFADADKILHEHILLTQRTVMYADSDIPLNKNLFEEKVNYQSMCDTLAKSIRDLNKKLSRVQSSEFNKFRQQVTNQLMESENNISDYDDNFLANDKLVMKQELHWTIQKHEGSYGNKSTNMRTKLANEHKALKHYMEAMMHVDLVLTYLDEYQKAYQVHSRQLQLQLVVDPKQTQVTFALQASNRWKEAARQMYLAIPQLDLKRGVHLPFKNNARNFHKYAIDAAKLCVKNAEILMKNIPKLEEIKLETPLVDSWEDLDGKI